MLEVTLGTRAGAWALLDDILAGSRDLVGVWENWPRLFELSRDILLRHGEAGVALLREHPVAAFTRECPLTNWSWHRPRGYPNDARLSDFFYGHGSIAESVSGASPRGQDLLAFHQQGGLAEAIRERRALLARLVDSTAERVGEAEVLTLGAQHLREAALVSHATELRRWVALDRDAETAEEIADAFADLPALTALPISLERTMLHPLEFGRFDLVYAATGCEYLADREARRLVEAMFAVLKPGGQALLASLQPDLPELGYMTAYMDWRPALRGEAQLRSLLDCIPDAACTRKSVFSGCNGRIAYALLERAGDRGRRPRAVPGGAPAPPWDRPAG
ncbi:class I SAM-dependent methyltransferase [Roseomonas sp. OT10]|uniref:class I SAM-dependent methyltransferase n=1 Tax=Roseomonas cutis TaxID=2897332 RepID=UPI001E3780C1|nr:class I SAM-dependent methyltransferase [Roseomonas sp. OT10]UFN48021.1 class I SAM-dependent methyltransferase [Roseomonas sp. OT10]